MNRAAKRQQKKLAKKAARAHQNAAAGSAPAVQDAMEAALQHHRAGRLAQAAALYEQVLGIAPNHAPALHLLGLVKHQTGDNPTALKLIRQAIRQAPKDAEAHTHLGAVLQDLGDLDKAVEAYRTALSLDPGSAKAHLNLATALSDLGRFEDAAASYRAVLERVPGHAGAYLGLSVVQSFDADAPELNTIEALLSGADLGPGDRAQLHYAAGRMCESAKVEPERTFAHYRDGARFKRQTLNYDITATEASLAAIAHAFNAARFMGVRSAKPSHRSPIFIISMPRSGSSLVEQILASHPDVHGAGERMELHTLVQDAAQRLGRAFPDVLEAMGEDRFAHLSQAYRGALAKALPSGEPVRTTDKMPGNFRYLGLIALAMPDARIVHVHRDPVDTCLSCFKTLFTTGQPYSYDLAELGRYYRAYEGLMAHWRTVLPDGMMLDVRYEELVTEPEPQIREILAHCGLNWDARCIDFHRTARPVKTASATQVRQPLYTDAIGRWKAYAPHLAPLLDALGESAEDRDGHSGA